MVSLTAFGFLSSYFIWNNFLNSRFEQELERRIQDEKNKKWKLCYEIIETSHILLSYYLQIRLESLESNDRKWLTVHGGIN